jgi:hypothetical protein
MTNSTQLLTLQAVTAVDRQEIRDILDTPHLARRGLDNGIQEVHTVAWSQGQRTFGVRLADDLFGSVELSRDEDDRTAWELSVVLADHKRPLDGARSAIAAMFYAFGVLKAESVWFWAPKSNVQIQAFAEQLGFSRLNALKMPDGNSASTYELSRTGWSRANDGALNMFLVESVEIHDHDRSWIGQDTGFTTVKR